MMLNFSFIAPLCQQSLVRVVVIYHHHHHHLPPWIRSFDLFRHRRVAIISWGVRDPIFLGVCRWGRVSGSGVVHSFEVVDPVLFVFESHVLYSRDLWFLMTSLLILSSLVYPVTLLRKRISAASRRVMSLFVVTHDCYYYYYYYY